MTASAVWLNLTIKASRSADAGSACSQSEGTRGPSAWARSDAPVIRRTEDGKAVLSGRLFLWRAPLAATDSWPIERVEALRKLPSSNRCGDLIVGSSSGLLQVTSVRFGDATRITVAHAPEPLCMEALDIVHSSNLSPVLTLFNSAQSVIIQGHP